MKIRDLHKELRNWIADEVFPQNKIPSVRHLAQRFGSSPVSVLKVLKKLQYEERLKQFPGKKGYFLPRSPYPNQSVVSPPQPRYKQISQTLQEEILIGTHAPSSDFLTLRNIRSRFRCSFSTAQKAVLELLREGAVRREGNGYRVNAVVGEEKRNSHVYVMGSANEIASLHSWFFPCIRGMESSMNSLQWGHLRFYFGRKSLDDPEPEGHRVAGIVNVFFQGKHRARELFAQHDNIPLVLIDPAELPAESLPSHPNMYHIVADNRRIGREMGLHLASLGHRHIAVFAPDQWLHRNAWTRRRLVGLQEIFPRGETDGDRKMTVFAPRPPDTDPHSELSDARKLLSDSKGKLVESGLFSEELAHDIFLRTEQNLKTLSRMGAALQRHFNRALLNPDITAWIGINDVTAFSAYGFLQKNGYRIPRHLSVAGFDNSPLTYRLGITSYDLNLEGMGHLAIQCLAHPERVRRNSEGNIVVKGVLVRRHSTGKPAEKKLRIAMD